MSNAQFKEMMRQMELSNKVYLTDEGKKRLENMEDAHEENQERSVQFV